MKKKVLTKYAAPIFETNAGAEAEWFGYYNYDTLNYDQTKMLCNRADMDGCAIEKGMQIEVGYYELADGSWHHIGNTDAFNWQQGAMLQWLPGKGNENKVIYNFSADNHFKSRIFDIATQEENVIDFPIYCVLPSGDKALALNYERSYWCRAYHYQSVANPAYDVQVADDDGIFEVNLQNNTVRRIVRIQDVIAMDAQPYFADAKHWLEHIMVSPDGSRFVFLHRFTLGVGYATRICIADIDGSNLQVIAGWDKYDWSHFGWKGNDEFVIYTVESSKLVQAVATPVMAAAAPRKTIKTRLISVAKKCIPASIRARARKRYYQHYRREAGSGFRLVGKYDMPALRIDGHPSFTNDCKYMVTDSYPFEDGMRHLIIMNTETGKACVIAKLHAALWGTPASCDLHPKLCGNNAFVVVDTAYTGRHRMICFKIDWEQVKRRIG